MINCFLWKTYFLSIIHASFKLFKDLSNGWMKFLRTYNSIMSYFCFPSQISNTKKQNNFHYESQENWKEFSYIFMWNVWCFIFDVTWGKLFCLLLLCNITFMFSAPFQLFFCGFYAIKWCHIMDMKLKSGSGDYFHHSINHNKFKEYLIFWIELNIK